MGLSNAMLDELTAGIRTPQEMETLYAQMLQHMINRWKRRCRRTWTMRPTVAAMAMCATARTARRGRTVQSSLKQRLEVYRPANVDGRLAHPKRIPATSLEQPDCDPAHWRSISPAT